MNHSKAFKDIDKLLRVGAKIVKYDAEPLNVFGENYGSIMLKVDFTIENSHGRRTIYTVAKLIPQDAFALKVFNTAVTFKSEINFYAEVIPTLQEFQMAANASMIADYFPKFYGGRISLNPYTDVVDNSAIILLENLKVEGYINEDRHVGFDLNTTKIILDHIANLQAAVTALEIKNPETFDKVIMKNYTGWNFMMIEDCDLPEGYLREIGEDIHLSHLVPKIEEMYKSISNKKDEKTRWFSISHNDLWVNNIMIKLNNSKTEVKFLDFQCYDRGSCVKDLIFFLFTSVQTSVLKYHFDKLLKYYYDQFIKNLRELDIDVTGFTHKSFENELANEVTREIFHATLMLQVVMGPKHEKGDAEPPKMELPKEGEKPKPPPFKSPYQMKERLWTVWEQAARKKWI